jgi:hypothetical protein
LDGAPLSHPHPDALQALQAALGQAPHPRQFFLELVGPHRVPPRHQRPQKPHILLAAGEVPAAAHQQGLVHGLLETPMSLFAVAVLVAAVRIGRLADHAVVTQQRLVPGRVLLRIAVLVNSHRHAIGAMALRHRSQLPERIL